MDELEQLELLRQQGQRDQGPDDLLDQQRNLSVRQKMAMMLMGQNQQPQGQMISGQYVAPNWAQQLTPVVNQLAGAYLTKQAEDESSKIARQLRQGKMAAEQEVMNAMSPTPAKVTELAGPAYKGQAPVAIQDAKGPDWAKALAATNNPYGAGKDLRSTILKQMNPEDTADYKNYLKSGFKGSFNEYLDMDANRKRSVNSVTLTMPSESERKAGTMVKILDSNLLQMQQALGVDPTAVKPNVPASIVEAIAGPNVLSRSMKPEQRQIIEDSQLDVLDAALTLRTGAAYTREQLNGMRDTYFPKIGDKPAAVVAKRQRLESLIEGAYISAGRATPPRVSAPYDAAANVPKPNVNKELNIPAAPKVPKFLGFEENK